MLVFLIIFSLLLAAIVVFNYTLIKRINTMNELSQKQKNYWVFLISYLPVLGGIYFLIQNKNKKL